jgi:hypothetical protein
VQVFAQAVEAETLDAAAAMNVCACKCVCLQALTCSCDFCTLVLFAHC